MQARIAALASHMRPVPDPLITGGVACLELFMRRAFAYGDSSHYLFLSTMIRSNAAGNPSFFEYGPGT
jgi:hypothetical protein